MQGIVTSGTLYTQVPWNRMTMSGRPTFRSMHTRLPVVTSPSAEPMSVIEAKLQSRRSLTVTNEDPLIQRMIEGARNQVEVDTMRAIVWQRRKLTLDMWPDNLDLYCCPVVSVESIKYKDITGTQQTLATSVYVVRTDLEPCEIRLQYMQYWPVTLPQAGVIEVTFTAGYLVPFTVDPSTDVLTFSDYVPTNGDAFKLTNSGGLLPSPLVEKRTYYVVSANGSTCKLSLTSGGGAIDLTTSGIGLSFLGEVPQSLMTALRKRVAVEFADREGSSVAADCERSYLQSLRAVQYVGM